MSLRYEQYEALKRGRKYIYTKYWFWIDLRNKFYCIPPIRKFATKKMEEAYSCLRHWPTQYESGEPMFSKDDFTKDAGHE